jgi:heme/copper-type cytochrome/quinol oxidase subunit 1
VALLLFWGLIARFYQRFAQVNTYYLLFTMPAILIGVVAIRTSSFPIGVHHIFDDALLGFGGLLFLALTVHLYRHMMRKQ